MVFLQKQHFFSINKSSVMKIISIYMNLNHKVGSTRLGKQKMVVCFVNKICSIFRLIKGI